MISGRIDVRRTAGGLRLWIPAPGVSPRRSVRLSYAQAGDVIAAIRADTLRPAAGNPTCYLAADETGGARAVLADVCAELCLRDQDMQALGDALSAHMPDRMIPLPSPRTGLAHVMYAPACG